MKPLVLTRQVKLSKFEVLMEIGRQERREELHSVLMIAERHGAVTAENVCSELLPGRPLAVGAAVIDRCEYLDLIDRKGTLTTAGEEALKTQKVFVPERGRYLVWYSEDTLLPQTLLHLQPVSELQVNDEVALARSGGTQPQNTEKTEDVSDKFSPLVGRTFNLMGPGGGAVTIRAVDPNGVPKKPDKSDAMKITLMLPPAGEPRLGIEGRFRRTLDPPEIGFDEAWTQALGPLAQTWEGSSRPPALLVQFSGLNDAELASFTKTVELREPTLTRFGAFDDTHVDEVPIKPESRSDANQWGEWLLERSINGYVNGPQFRELATACARRFPDYELELPSLDQMAVKLRNQTTEDGRLTPRYWFVQTPRDLQVIEP